MEWLSSLKTAIDYMEGHLLMDVGADEVADAVHISSFYFQKGFKIVTGYSVGEYLRNRRLYLAGLDVIRGEEKIIDLAYKYGYDTPESFSKAFSRFHGLSPMQLKAKPFQIRVFQPLSIEVTIKGGNKMEYIVEKMEPFKVIGFERVFSFETSYQEIPKFWDEFCNQYMKPMLASGHPEGEIQQAVINYDIGMFGICIDDQQGENKFKYMIAGLYKGGSVPEGMTVFEIPAHEWVKFKCVGSMPESLQTVNTRIFREWLPGNPDLEIAANINIEWYSQGDTQSTDYESAIWIPVRRK